MRITRRKIRPAIAGGAPDRDPENGLGRDEAEAFATPARSVDPYAAWLALREEEQQRSRPQIRWVYRRQAPAASPVPAGDRASSNDGELVGSP
jgi:hypothetical protein